MPRLILMRHGKSDWTGSGASDRDRPLARRGVRAAGLMGRYLAACAPPDLALVSPAARTLDTFARAAAAAAWDLEPVIEERLYLAGAGEVLGLVGAAAGSAEAVLVVGHEPSCSDLVETLTGGVVRFPTAAVAVIEGGSPWRALGPGWGVLHSLVLPRDLDAFAR